MGSKTERSSTKVSRERRGTVNRYITECRVPVPEVWVKKVRETWWLSVLLEILKSQASKCVLDPSFYWKPVTFSEQRGCTHMPALAGDKSGCMILYALKFVQCVVRVGWLLACLTSQQHASVSQGRICPDNLTNCHTEIEVADPTFHLTQSQYTDTGPTSPSADPITPGAWQGSHWSANFKVTGMTRPRKNRVASGIRTRDLPLSRRTPYH